jgi:hypothetical protein
VAQVEHPVAGGQQPNDKAINKAARDLGLDRNEVQRAKKIADIAPEAKEAAREAGLDDNQSALLEVAKEKEPEQQVAKVEEIATKKKRSRGAAAQEQIAPPPSSSDVGYGAKVTTLDKWKTLATTERQALLSVKREDFDYIPKFNKQTNDSIEWADWSWNPVTGCEHNCVYCYARDIANRFYPHGFVPAIKPAALLTPRSASVPNGADSDTRYRNVFTCSMADLFGRWVPAEWIEAVLRAHPGSLDS